MNKGPNPKLFLGLAAIALVMGGGMCYVALNNLGDEQAKLRDLKAKSKDARQLQAEVAKSQASVTDTATKLNHLEQGIPQLAYVPTLLSELEKVGKESGIDVLGVRPLPAAVSPGHKDDSAGSVRKKKTYEELDIEVKGRGNYRSVMTFIKALEVFPKIVAARTIALDPKNVPGQMSDKLDVTINLRTYVFAPSATTPTDPGVKSAMLGGTRHAG